VNLEFLSHSEIETLACAIQFAGSLKPGDVVALSGKLGAGKTLFCRGVAQGLGYAGNVASPTYALAHEYAARIPIVHMDLYRLAPGSDWEEIGLQHYLNGEGICLIEWPDRLPIGLQQFTYRVDLDLAGDTQRRIRIRSTV
jgi:tRNA threonylcarbamoyladenosine biosynthesis protein TsaE